jgi:hypothetical protein
MILTGSRFISICKLMFGRDWASGAAKLFCKSAKTMQRWGDDGPPPDARPTLARRLEDHIAECGAELHELRADAIEW